MNKGFIIMVAMMAYLLSLSLLIKQAEAVDIHALDNEQQVLGVTSIDAEPIISNINIDAIEAELNKTKAYIANIISEIQALAANKTSLDYDIEQVKTYIKINAADKIDVQGVISLLDRAGKKGSDAIKKKADAIKEVLKSSLSEEQIEAFVNKTSNLLAEWLQKIGVTEDDIKKKVSYDENHKLLRTLVVGVAALHAFAVNNNPAKGLTLALNHLSIFTGEELIGTYCGTKSIKKTEGPVIMLQNEQQATPSSNQPPATYPTSWSLVSQGIIGPVLNQGSCGCCYSFSAVEALEGLYAAQNNKSQYSLSEQQIVDCDTSNDGCNGGTYQSAWSYINSVGGITTDTNYPYTSGNGQSGTCQTNDAGEGVLTTTTQYPYKGVYSDSQMQAAAYFQPVSIAIQASSSCFQNYKSGVLTPQNCNCGTDVDHAVLLVGWGVTSDNTQYWIVKNSWGSSWGQSGYVWIARLPASTNYCGMYQQPAYPTSSVLTAECAGPSPPTYCDLPTGNSATKMGSSIVMLLVSMIAMIISF